MSWVKTKTTFKKSSTLEKLLYTNIAIFFFLHIITFLYIASNSISSDFYEFYNKFWESNLLECLSLKAEINHNIKKPFTLISFMFVHQNFWHLFLNLMLLYFY